MLCAGGQRMPVGGFAARFAAQLKCSNILQRQLSQISSEAVVQLKDGAGAVYLCTEPIFDVMEVAVGQDANGHTPQDLFQDVLSLIPHFADPSSELGAVRARDASSPVTITGTMTGALCTIETVSLSDHAEGLCHGWVGFDLGFEGGAQDRLLFRPKQHVTEEMLPVLLQAIWPVLREDLLAEEQARGRPPTEQALLWTIATRTDSAVMVLNAEGKLLDCNEAGREYLDSGKLFRIGSEGNMRCIQDLETRSVNEAIRRCGRVDRAPDEAATAEGGAAEECLLFLREQDGEQALPVSFTRYQTSDDSEPMVVVILPRQPDRSRIELVAQKMGLSPTEARVAALLQLGLTNREAACIAGVKEQTFNTYAKRVLSKMNVGSRSQVAQRLTWQAAWGRMA